MCRASRAAAQGTCARRRTDDDVSICHTPYPSDTHTANRRWPKTSTQFRTSECLRCGTGYADIRVGTRYAADTRHHSSLRKLTRTCAVLQEEMGSQLKAAIAEGDEQAATAARKAMWEAMYPVYRAAAELADIWNELAPRANL